MIRRPTLLPITLLLLAGPWSEWAIAQSIPTAIPYTGSVAVDGIPFNGNGQFKFAIVNENGTTTYWSNDSTSSAGSEPANAVTVAVSDGLYALELGNQDLANMQLIPPAVFYTPATFLRVWFNDGVHDFQLLSPDRQLVSVPYAYQAEKAREVSGFGTVVKSIGLAGSAETPLRDEIVLEGEGSVEIQRPAGTNTIRIVGTVDTGGAVTDVACPAACISPDEISGPLTDALIPDLNTLSGTLTAAQLPNIGALAGTVTDAQVPDLGTLSGILTDAQIPPAISRDSEVTAGVSAALATHTANASAHHAKTTTFTELTDSIADAQIPQAITRDAEVPGLAGPTVNSAIVTHAADASAHHAKTTTFTELTDSIADAQIPPAVTRDTEVPGLIGTAVDSAITTHAGDASAHHAKTVSFTELTDSIADGQIPQAITRDTELTWANLTGIPAGFADGIDDVGSIAETDPQVGAIGENRVPKWSSTALVDGQIYDNGTFVGIGTTTQTPAPAALLEVAGIVRVVSLAAGYGRVVMPNQSAPAGQTTTLNAPCPGNTNVLSGGYELDTLPPLVTVLGSWPPNGNSWSVKIENLSLADFAVNIFAVCAAIQ